MLTYLIREPIVPSWPWYSLSLLVFILLSLIASRRLTGKWYPAFLPGVVSFSTLLLLSLIDVALEQQVFVWAATALFYGTLLGIYRLKIIPSDETARALLNMAALASLFFTYAAAYGLYLNYDVPLALLMFVFFLVTSIVAFQTLYWAGRDDVREILLTALALGTIMGELIWAVHFWPVGYLTVGSAMLLFFYLLWRCVLDLLRESFTWKKSLIEGLLLALLLTLLLATSPWRMRA
ncbi:MAG: hypothetical protein IPJ68_03350 [Candidatus Moraniibacteriota bacterium]|nr:MAG: hypothetical protein IPJ68_03350 [Candidatus Moranbacteria bacterium]